MPDGRRSAPIPDQTIRAFVAIPLPEEILDGLGRVQRALSRRIPHGSVRWVRPNGIHLTLKFLGETPTDRLPAVEAALSAVARNATRFTFAVGGLGCFPIPHRPRVVWVGIEEPKGQLAGLQSAIEEALGNAGFSPERRSFSPHLTLGRVRRKASRGDATQIGEIVADAPPVSLGEVRAARVELVRSILKPGGAEYSVLSRFGLRDP